MPRQGLSRLVLVICGGLIAIGARGHARAQTTAVAARGESREIEEVIVTARKQNENLQTIPMAVTAITSAQIERAGIQDLNDVANQTAGLTYQEIGGSGLTQTPIIRGIVSGNIFTGGVNNVSVFLNGVYVSSRQSLDVNLLDIDRVEVLKGPQGTIFGQNSYAGAINYITKDPGAVWEGYASAEYGTNRWNLFTAAIGGPIIADTLAGRVAVSTGSFDGTFHNTANPSKNLQGYDEPYNVSATLVFTPIPGLTITPRVFAGERNRDQDANVLFPNNCGANATGGFTRFCGTAPTFTQASINPKAYGAHNTTLITSLNIEYKPTNDITLTSLSSYEYDGEKSLLDAAYNANGFPAYALNTATGAVALVGAPVYFGAGDTNDRDYSEEVRVRYQHNWLNLMVGGFYYTTQENVNTNFSVDSSILGPNQLYDPALSIFAFLLATPNPFTMPVETTVTSEFRRDLAAFGQVQIDLPYKFRLDAELRYTSEYDQLTVLPSAFQPSSHTNNVTSTFTNPRVSLDYRIDTDKMLYVSAAKGVRAGGIGVGSPEFPQEAFYKPETNWTYEFGARTDWLQHRLQVDATLFYVDLQNLQIQQASQDPNYPFTVTGNAGNATTKGFEVSATGKITEHLTADLNYAYTDPKFNGGQIAYGVQGCGVTAASQEQACGAPLIGMPAGLAVGGHQLPYARKNIVNVSVNYQTPVFSDFDGYARVDVRYQSSAFLDVTQRITLGGYALVNARIGFENGNWDVSLWAKNLLDTVYVTNADNQVRINNVNIIAPDEGLGRIVGVTLRYKFALSKPSRS